MPNCKNLVIKAIPENNPDKKYFFLIKNKTASIPKKADGIPVNSFELNKKKVGVKASNKAANSPVFLLKTSFPIR